MSTKRFGVVIEGDESGFSAFVPDLPGCIGAGSSLDDVKSDISSAIHAHIAWLIRDGDSVPEPRDVIPVEVSNASVMFVEVEVSNPRRSAKA
jgi:predicted RNase H-like HicB family nuclease